MDTQPPPSSYLSADRKIIKFIAVFGMPSVYYNRHLDRLTCSRLRLNCTLLAVTVYFVITLYLFNRVQMVYLFRSEHWLASLSDVVRGSSITYAYQLLVCVALVQRRRYTAYFHQLVEVDRHIWQRFHVQPDGDRVRRAFWRHMSGWVLNYLLLAWPSSMYYYGTVSLADCLFVTAYLVTAIGQGVVTLFVQYAAHCCQVRFECIRQRLAEAVQDRVGDRLGDVTAAMQLLNEMDEVKEHLSNGFCSLLTWKLAIDMLNAVLSVYFTCFKLLHRSGPNLVRGLVDFSTYELPFQVSNVLMVGYFQAIGDEVSDAITPGGMLARANAWISQFILSVIFSMSRL